MTNVFFIPRLPVLILIAFFWILQASFQITAANAQAAQSSRNDGVAHAAASAVISVAIYTALRNYGFTRPRAAASSLGVAVAVGAIKEITDSEIQAKDLGADGIGILSGLSLVIVMDLIW